MILSYQINGGARLQGEYRVRGAKNAALPILAASIMTEGETRIHNCPDISDVHVMRDIIQSLGAKTAADNDTVTSDCRGICRNEIPQELGASLRASVFFMAPLLSKTGGVAVPEPGGCHIGKRPVDIHIDVMRVFGAGVCETGEKIICSADRLCGADITLRFPSVGATENAVMAAVCAEGASRIRNCAREPEIVCLADYLRSCGAEIKGDGTDAIEINGVKRLHAADIRLMPDRIECGTYMAMAAATGGELFAEGINPEYLKSFTEAMEAAGCSFRYFDDGILLHKNDGLKGDIRIRTEPYPGFPTDLHPQFAAMMCRSGGGCEIEETLFESRYKYIEELKKTGGNIEVFQKKAIIKGVPKLYGAHMKAPDLRGGAALVTAALCAGGESVIDNTQYIQRGYCGFDETIRSLGGDIWTI